MHSRHADHIFMIRVAQHQHGGFFVRISWDPGASWFDSLEISANWRINYYFKDPIHMENLIGFLGGIIYEGWTKHLQHLFSLLINGPEEAYCVSTLQGSIVCSICSTSFSLVWDPRDTHGFSWAPLVVQMIVLALLEDKQFQKGRTVMSLSK
jgi:hypothetical protein